MSERDSMNGAEMTNEEAWAWRETRAKALADSGITYDELAAQVNRGWFDNSKFRLTWMTVSGIDKAMSDEEPA